jgi:hypothetical protein
MATRTLTYRLSSTSPLLMHNGQLVNPLNKWSKAMKSISSKRKKTDADLEELARLEFLGSLYMTANGPAVPASNLTATIVAAAKKHREGDLAKTGVIVDDHAVLEYDGPRVPEEMWADERFRDSRAVRVGQARIIRTRPVFEAWETTVSLTVDDEIVNPSRVDDWMNTAGRIVGFCELRPIMGRFTAKRVAAA